MEESDERDRLQQDIEQIHQVLSADEGGCSDEDEDVDVNNAILNDRSTLGGEVHIETAAHDELQPSNLAAEQQNQTPIQALLDQNKQYQEMIQQILTQVHQALENNLQEQKDFENRLLAAGGQGYDGLPINRKPVARAMVSFFRPYFRDENGDVPPLNIEAKERKEMLQQDPFLEKRSPWSSYELNNLKEGVQNDRLRRIQQPLWNKRELLQDKIVNAALDDNEKDSLQEKIDALNETINNSQTSVRAENGDHTSDEDIDWMRISSMDLDGERTALECQLQWNVLQNPAIIKGQWTSQEEEKLRKLVKKYKERHWGRIASELGSGRTSFQCVQHYRVNLCTDISKKCFTREDDKILLELVKKYRVGNYIPYTKVAYFMEGYSGKQVCMHWSTALNPDIKNGKWSREEDQLLRDAVARYGAKNWSKIATEVPGRTFMQSRDRWCLHLAPTVKRGAWNAKEDLRMIELIIKHGLGNWRKVSNDMVDGEDNCSRTCNSLLVRFRNMVKKLMTTRKRSCNTEKLSSDSILEILRKEKILQCQAEQQTEPAPPVIMKKKRLPDKKVNPKVEEKSLEENIIELLKPMTHHGISKKCNKRGKHKVRQSLNNKAAYAMLLKVYNVKVKEESRIVQNMMGVNSYVNTNKMPTTSAVTPQRVAFTPHPQTFATPATQTLQHMLNVEKSQTPCQPAVKEVLTEKQQSLQQPNTLTSSSILKVPTPKVTLVPPSHSTDAEAADENDVDMESVCSVDDVGMPSLESDVEEATEPAIPVLSREIPTRAVVVPEGVGQQQLAMSISDEQMIATPAEELSVPAPIQAAEQKEQHDSGVFVTPSKSASPCESPLGSRATQIPVASLTSQVESPGPSIASVRPPVYKSLPTVVQEIPPVPVALHMAPNSAQGASPLPDSIPTNMVSQEIRQVITTPQALNFQVPQTPGNPYPTSLLMANTATLSPITSPGNTLLTQLANVVQQGGQLQPISSPVGTIPANAMNCIPPTQLQQNMILVGSAPVVPIFIPGIGNVFGFMPGNMQLAAAGLANNQLGANLQMSSNGTSQPMGMSPAMGNLHPGLNTPPMMPMMYGPGFMQPNMGNAQPMMGMIPGMGISQPMMGMTPGTGYPQQGPGYPQYGTTAQNVTNIAPGFINGQTGFSTQQPSTTSTQPISEGTRSQQPPTTPTSEVNSFQQPTATPISEGCSSQQPATTPISGGNSFQQPAATPISEGCSSQQPATTLISEGNSFQQPAATPISECCSSQQPATTPISEGNGFQQPAATPIYDGSSSQHPATIPVSEANSFQQPVTTLIPESNHFPQPATAPIPEGNNFQQPAITPIIHVTGFQQPTTTPTCESDSFQQPGVLASLNVPLGKITEDKIKGDKVTVVDPTVEVAPNENNTRGQAVTGVIPTVEVVPGTNLGNEDRRHTGTELAPVSEVVLVGNTEAICREPQMKGLSLKLNESRECDGSGIQAETVKQSNAKVPIRIQGIHPLTTVQATDNIQPSTMLKDMLHTHSNNNGKKGQSLSSVLPSLNEKPTDSCGLSAFLPNLRDTDDVVNKLPSWDGLDIDADSGPMLQQLDVLNVNDVPQQIVNDFQRKNTTPTVQTSLSAQPACFDLPSINTDSGTNVPEADSSPHPVCDVQTNVTPQSSSFVNPTIVGTQTFPNVQENTILTVTSLQPNVSVQSSQSIVNSSCVGPNSSLHSISSDSIDKPPGSHSYPIPNVDPSVQPAPSMQSSTSPAITLQSVTDAQPVGTKQGQTDSNVLPITVPCLKPTTVTQQGVKILRPVSTTGIPAVQPSPNVPGWKIISPGTHSGRSPKLTVRQQVKMLRPTGRLQTILHPPTGTPTVEHLQHPSRSVASSHTTVNPSVVKTTGDYTQTPSRPVARSQNTANLSSSIQTCIPTRPPFAGKKMPSQVSNSATDSLSSVLPCLTAMSDPPPVQRQQCTQKTGPYEKHPKIIEFRIDPLTKRIVRERRVSYRDPQDDARWSQARKSTMARVNAMAENLLGTDSAEKTIPLLPPNAATLTALKTLLLHRKILEKNVRGYTGEPKDNAKIYTGYMASRDSPQEDASQLAMPSSSCSEEKRAQQSGNSSDQHPLAHILDTANFKRLQDRFMSVFAWPALLSTVPPKSKPAARSRGRPKKFKQKQDTTKIARKRIIENIDESRMASEEPTAKATKIN